MDRQDAFKATYFRPDFTVRRIEVEGIIAASASPIIQTGPEWIEDNTNEPYDGDIWMPTI
ncbi:MAG: hypothetical protein LBE56_03850 [Tannerella sp.]|nr:hypothetical protein [Tannerella sp.]